SFNGTLFIAPETGRYIANVQFFYRVMSVPVGSGPVTPEQPPEIVLFSTRVADPTPIIMPFTVTYETAGNYSLARYGCVTSTQDFELDAGQMLTLGYNANSGGLYATDFAYSLRWSLHRIK